LSNFSPIHGRNRITGITLFFCNCRRRQVQIAVT